LEVYSINDGLMSMRGNYSSGVYGFPQCSELCRSYAAYLLCVVLLTAYAISY